jgi:hypothetical protein
LGIYSCYSRNNEIRVLPVWQLTDTRVLTFTGSQYRPFPLRLPRVVSNHYSPHTRLFCYAGRMDLSLAYCQDEDHYKRNSKPIIREKYSSIQQSQYMQPSSRRNRPCQINSALLKKKINLKSDTFVYRCFYD